MKNVEKVAKTVNVPLSNQQLRMLEKLVGGRLEWLDREGHLDAERHGGLVALHQLILSMLGW